MFDAYPIALPNGDFGSIDEDLRVRISNCLFFNLASDGYVVYMTDAAGPGNGKLGGGVVLPFYDQHLRNHASGVDSDASGVGDMSFYLLWTPAESDDPHPPDPFLSARNFSLMAGRSIPT